MAGDRDDAEKTEDPTSKRIEELRKEGAIHASQEVAKVSSLFVGFWILAMLCGNLFAGFQNIIIRVYGMISMTSEALEVQGIIQILSMIIKEIGWILLILFLAVAFVASFAVLIQTKFNVKEGLIKFKMLYLNPINGIKRIFSATSMMNVLTGVLKIAIILPIGYYALVSYAPDMVALIHLSVSAVLKFIGTAMSDIFWKVLYVMIVLAVWDFVWTKRQWLKKNRMTKDEVKDERKSVEGDERTKQLMRRKGLQRIMNRIARSVPQADVVVTNPTHYAVALKYDRAVMRAPTVVAKGRGFMALRIRELARKAGVPVLERKPLARALYASVEVGREIPHELFKAVAEVLAYVYKLRNPYRYLQQGQGR